MHSELQKLIGKIAHTEYRIIHNRFEERRGFVFREQKTGFWTIVHARKKKDCAGTFSAGKMTGLWTYWWHDGTKMAECQYKEGVFKKFHRFWNHKGIEITKKSDHIEKFLIALVHLRVIHET